MLEPKKEEDEPVILQMPTPIPVTSPEYWRGAEAALLVALDKNLDRDTINKMLETAQKALGVSNK